MLIKIKIFYNQKSYLLFNYRDIESIYCLAKWAAKKYKIQGGALTMRFGESNFTGATVSHLHAHLIYPAVGKRNHSKTVVFPIG